MKTIVLGMLTLIAVIVVIALVVWGILKLIHKFQKDGELEHPWPAETPVEIQFKMDRAWEYWILQVRKKKNFRLFKDSGWKDVLLYYKWCGNRFTWNHISWPVGIHQFREYETMKSIIHTYGDLDAYYGLTEGYEEYMKQTFSEE